MWFFFNFYHNNYSVHRLIGSLWANIKVITITKWFNQQTFFVYCLCIMGPVIFDIFKRLILFSVIKFKRQSQSHVVESMLNYLYSFYEQNLFYRSDSYLCLNSNERRFDECRRICLLNNYLSIRFIFSTYNTLSSSSSSLT